MCAEFLTFICVPRCKSTSSGSLIQVHGRVRGLDAGPLYKMGFLLVALSSTSSISEAFLLLELQEAVRDAYCPAFLTKNRH
jgi:hypothetical protein